MINIRFLYMVIFCPVRESLQNLTINWVCKPASRDRASAPFHDLICPAFLTAVFPALYQHGNHLIILQEAVKTSTNPPAIFMEM
ncbi:hypothetical protein [Desulfofundulus thermobenzoicus]|uniref:hypothetical protein n=1 Tax=Desulfofundulus thermobenzoicus TaxID=29376 RepID=UPI0018837A99|nr:hypothetical protein [Desulfofundulus thermobenzoicus]